MMVLDERSDEQQDNMSPILRAAELIVQNVKLFSLGQSRELTEKLDIIIHSTTLLVWLKTHTWL